MRTVRTITTATAVALLAGSTYAMSASAAVTAIDRAPVRSWTPPTDFAGIDIGPDGFAYVSTMSDRVDIYESDAYADAAPDRVLAGPSTQLQNVTAVAFDKDGLLYVADAGLDSITVYPKGASGDVAPIRRIAGALTQLKDPRGLAVDVYGNAWVADAVTGLLRFPHYFNGNVEPGGWVRGPATMLDDPTDVEINLEGDVHVPEPGRGVLVFSQFADGDVAPKRIVDRLGAPLTGVGQVATDSRHNLYVTDHAADAVVVFPAHASGDVEPKLVLDGAATGLDDPSMVALTPDRTLFVGSNAAHRIDVFTPLIPRTPPSPVRSLKVVGKPTAKHWSVEWDYPLDDGGAGVTYVVSVSRNGVPVFTKSWGWLTRKDVRKAGTYAVTVTAQNVVGSAPTVGPVTFTVAKIAPDRPRALQVSGKAGSAKRTFTWKKPAWDGGAKVTGYSFAVRHEGRAWVTRLLKPGKRKVTVSRSALGSGKHTVFVKAVNAKGWGKQAKKKFTVKP